MDQRDYVLPSGGLKLYVTEWGDPGARPLIMLHGIRGYAETFAGLAARLPAGFRVIAYDQRGRGRSAWDPGGNYYTDAYVADLAAVADTLGLDSFDLLGHSMGGINAIVYAATHPGRVGRLIIEDAGPGAFETSAGATRIQRELAATPAQFESWEEASQYMRALRPSVTEDARQQRLLNMLKPGDAGGYTWRYDHAGIAAARLHPDPSRVVALAPYVQALACPTLVIRGGRSDYLQPEMAQGMSELNPRISVVEIPEAGHYVHDDQPEHFARVVGDFLLRPTA